MHYQSRPNVSKLSHTFKYIYIYINLSIRDDSHSVDDSLCFRILNQIKLSEKLNLIRLADDGVTYSDLSNQFAVSTCAVDQIVKNRNEYEQVDSSVQKRNFATLETKIKVIHLMMKKKNANEVGRICKIDRKRAKTIFNNRDKWVNLEKSGAPVSIRRALYAKFKPIDDEVMNFINLSDPNVFLSQKVTYRRVHSKLQPISVFQNLKLRTAGYRTFYVDLECSLH